LQIVYDGDSFAAAPFAVTKDAKVLLLRRKAFGFGTAARIAATALTAFLEGGISRVDDVAFFGHGVIVRPFA
jgi:hypothetical protein